MSFHPPLRPEASKMKEAKEWYEEFMEKDEVLLYITASLGVFLPGIVYFIYHKVHKIYMTYALKKEAERQAEEAARCEVAIICLGPEGGPSDGYCSRLEQLLRPELSNPPHRWSARTIKAGQLSQFKGICVFLVDSTDGRPSECSEWILENLEDVAADQKARKKTNFECIRFAVAGFDGGDEKSNQYNKTAQTLLKRLKILGSKLMIPMEPFDTKKDAETLQLHFTAWCELLFESMDRNLPGGESESEGESTDDETDDEDETDRRKKDL